MPPVNSFRNKFSSYLFASYPFLWVKTHEEKKVIDDIISLGLGNGDLSFYEWDCISGITKLERSKDKEASTSKKAGEKDEDKLKEKYHRRVVANTQKPGDALDFIKKTTEGRQVFILKDFHPFFANPGFVRSTRNLVDELKNKGNMIVFVSPMYSIPEELAKDIQLIDYQLPDEAALGARLDYVVESAKQDLKDPTAKAAFDIKPENKRLAIEAARGMTDTEAENAFTLAIVENKKFDQGFVKTVFSEKIVQIKKNSLLTYIEPNLSFSEIGGLSGLKAWINLRAKAYEESAREYGLPYPKGILLAGIPGCGKTLLAKATANELGFPLFQLDVGALFGKLVGETEENFRKVIAAVEALGRCVLFID